MTFSVNKLSAVNWHIHLLFTNYKDKPNYSDTKLVAHSNDKVSWKYSL